MTFTTKAMTMTNNKCGQKQQTMAADDNYGSIIPILNK